MMVFDVLMKIVMIFCFRLLSNVNDCVVPSINSYSSVDDDVIGGIYLHLIV